ncbi:Molybdopterin synthase catalytic subunit, partial [Chytridiales sp. JEL 0842]
MDYIDIRHEPVQLSDLINKTRSDEAGAIATFSGTTRSTFTYKGVTKRVLSLEYEGYVPMAEKELRKLINTARQKWASLIGIAVYHRLGAVPVGEESVLIAVSSPHRVDALEAVHWMIDELKRSVPIWKKEIYEDGSMWKANCEG